jgi:CheY-like chemotaxis protein
MAKSSPPDPARASAATSHLPGSGRVLVIEDEASIRDTLEVLITIEGCEARTAPDGARALALLQEWTPDLILLDLSLPGMTGEEFIRTYHRSGGPHVPIILMTAWEVSPAEALDMGATGVLSKPFDATALLEVVAGFADCGDA